MNTPVARSSRHPRVSRIRAGTRELVQRIAAVIRAAATGQISPARTRVLSLARTREGDLDADRGDLFIGKANKTAIATLVERSTGYALLVHLPDGYKPEQVAPALAATIQTLPDTLRRSLTWDQGPEMRDWKQIRIHTGIEIYFCDPKSPWQRDTNENTNGLLRQYFPKGTDLGKVTARQLAQVADELNDRPRKRLDFYKPTERLAELLLR